MFQPNEADNRALRQYASEVSTAALQGRLSSVEIMEPILTITSNHTADTNDGRIREEQGKVQLLNALTLLPVVQTEILVSCLRISAYQLVEITELERERPERLEGFLNKHGETLKLFLALGVDTLIALWLHWNHTELHYMLIHEPQIEAVKIIQDATSKMLNYLQHVRKHRLGAFEDARGKMVGFMGKMRSAIYASFDIHLLQIPRFLHLDSKYEIHKLNLRDFNNIRVLDDDGKPQKVAYAPGPLTAAVGTTPFDPSWHKHNLSVGYTSGQKITPMSPLQYEMTHGPPAPTNQFQPVQPIHHPILQHAHPSQPVQPMYQPMQPAQPLHHIPPQSGIHTPIVKVTETPPPKPRYPPTSRFVELNVPYDDYMAEIKRKSDENRARAIAAPIPMISYDPHAGRYRCSTPEIGMRHSDFDATPRISRKAASHEHLTAHFGSLSLEETHRASRRRSERLSPHDIPASYEGTNSGKEERSRKTSGSTRRSTHRASSRDSDSNHTDDETEGTDRRSKKSSTTGRSKSRQSRDSEYEVASSTKKNTSGSKSRSRARIQTPESADETEGVPRTKEKRKSNRSEGSKYYD